MHVDYTEQPRNQGGRPSRTFTFTAEQLGALLGISPSAVLKRDERGQNLLEQRRYGVIKDVTEEPKKKSTVANVDVDKDRAEVVSDLLRRLNEHRAVETPESALAYAYNRGLKAGQDGAR